MIFTITELEHHPILYDLRYAPGEIELPDELKQVGDLTVKGKTELLRNTLGELRLQGHIAAQLDTRCDRCLEPASVAVDSDFDLFYRPADDHPHHGEVHLEEGEIDLGFYDGVSLALREVVREFILLNVPMRNICREDCRGLCPVCGENRNETQCACAVQHEDERWSRLKDLKL